MAAVEGTRAGVKDIHGGSHCAGAFTVHFPIGSLLLARLSVCGLHLTAFAHAMVATLEVIHLHSVSITAAALRRLLAACPSLRDLELRYCRHLRRIDFTTVGAANLRSLPKQLHACSASPCLTAHNVLDLCSK